jgi:transposase-like protein
MSIDLDDERKWADVLAELRWPNGFHCEQCDRVTPYWRHGTRPRTFICAVCRTSRSVTAGTLLHRTRLPLRYWFVAAAFLAEDGGISARSLAAELVVHVESAWQLAQRLRIALPPDHAVLEGVVEAMMAYVSCRPPPKTRGADRAVVLVACERPGADGAQAKSLVQPMLRGSVDHLARRVRGELVCTPQIHTSILFRWFFDRGRKRRGPISHRDVSDYEQLHKQKPAIPQEDSGLPFTARTGEPVGARRVCGELQWFLGWTHASVSRAWLDGYVREFVARSRGGGEGLQRALLAHALREQPYRFDDLVRARRATAAVLRAA